MRWADDLIKALVGTLTGLLLPIIVPSLGWAETSETSCLIRIDGVIYDSSPCNLNSEDEDIIRFGHLNLETQAGYWVYLIEREDGRYDGFWNEDFGANQAHTSLGILTREDRAGSDCFSNLSMFLCRNIPFDSPVYDVEFRSPEEGGHAVMGYLNGIEYEIQHPNWDTMQPYDVAQSADLDEDGHLETLIQVSNGGNCCPYDISILSYRGDGFFNYLDEHPISGGWGGTEILDEAGRSIIRVHDAPAGFNNLSHQRRERDYALVHGRPELIAQREELNVPSQVAGVSLEEVQSSDEQRKQLIYDIDQDGQQDVISCDYWQRWGILNCTAQISSTSKAINMECHRLVISNSVFGANRSHRLLCDGANVSY